jgi:hypothetical protein
LMYSQAQFAQTESFSSHWSHQIKVNSDIQYGSGQVLSWNSTVCFDDVNQFNSDQILISDFKMIMLFWEGAVSKYVHTYVALEWEYYACRCLIFNKVNTQMCCRQEFERLILIFPNNTLHTQTIWA